MRKIAITTGDPAGIGPEITEKAMRFFYPDPNVAYIIYGRTVNSLPKQIELIDRVEQANTPGKIYLLSINQDRIKLGKPTAESGKEALAILNKCTEDLNSKQLDAVVTCPISKTAIRFIDKDFIGHTEFLAEKAGIDNVIMSFWGPHFNLALLTTHIPICQLSEYLTEDFILKKLRLIVEEFHRYRNHLKVALLGFNPHAGEAGAFGKEEFIFKKAIDKLKTEGIEIDGPFPADTFFAEHAHKYNLVISAYHDQGLIPFKITSMGRGVNVTLGLPFIRTSVDHGTAYDIAGKNIASESSLLSAIELAEVLLNVDRKDKQNQYNWFAKYYDAYMEHVDYDSWVTFILNQYTKNKHANPDTVLELACGTATISSKLVKKGIDVIATDKSAEMLKIAAQKNFNPTLYCRDMLDPLPESRYDLILLLFDSINYLLDSSDIKLLFNNVYNGLKEGGMFIFDISTITNCETNFDGYVNLDDQGNEYLIHQSDINREKMIQTSKLTLFSKQGYLFGREDEEHKQKIYLVNEIKNLIDNSKLTLTGINSIGYPNNLLDFSGLDESFARLFFVLVK